MKDLKLLVEKIDTKLDKVDERLGSIDVTLVKQNKDLEHHIFRTSLAEEQLEILKKQIHPLSKRHELVNGIFRVIGMIATGLGLMIGIAKIALEFFFN